MCDPPVLKFQPSPPPPPYPAPKSYSRAIIIALTCDTHAHTNTQHKRLFGNVFIWMCAARRFLLLHFSIASLSRLAYHGLGMFLSGAEKIPEVVFMHDMGAVQQHVFIELHCCVTQVI